MAYFSGEATLVTDEYLNGQPTTARPHAEPQTRLPIQSTKSMAALLYHYNT